MRRLSAALTCASLILASAPGALASQNDAGMGMSKGMYNWTKASFDRLGPDPKVTIVLHIATPAAWTYDPASGALSSLTPVPQMNENPIGGIGIVVKKNPAPKKRGYPTPMPMNPNPRGSSAERAEATVSYPTPMPMNPDGVVAFPPNMDPGNYDVVVTIAARKLPQKTAYAKSATITFHVIVDPMQSASSQSASYAPQAKSGWTLAVRVQRIEMNRSEPPTVVMGTSNPASNSQ